MMFSATLSDEVKPICKKFMQNPTEHYVDEDTKLTLHGLQQYYIKLEEREKNRKLNELLDDLQFNQVIIFVKSTLRATELDKLLRECNFPSIAVHSGVSQEERIRRYKEFKDFNKRICVATDSKRAHFSSIQAAINSLPDTDVPAVILIAPGNYTEQLNVTRHGALTLLGMSDSPHEGRLYADLATDLSSPAPENEVQVWHNAANYQARFPDNAFTSVLSVGPTLNATLTGAGPTGFAVPEGTPFGNVDFRAYNIDFRNDEFPRANGPAHAVGVSRANAGFYSCGLYSY
ncbi:hypothetical protein BN1708_016942, partial [Verticillium longisporum]